MSIVCVMRYTIILKKNPNSHNIHYSRTDKKNDDTSKKTVMEKYSTY